MYFTGHDSYDYKIEQVLKDNWQEIIYYNSEGRLVHTNHFRRVLFVEFYQYRIGRYTKTYVYAKDIRNEPKKQFSPR